MTKVLLVGAGRMGLQHLRGVANDAKEIVVVYHKSDVEQRLHEVLDACDFD
ncbi:MAG: hypothetical protein ISR45_03660 [Rhodospirillales bacterium]|nr:hypothetical protein [Rhodospirillales bacterium]